MCCTLSRVLPRYSFYLHSVCSILYHATIVFLFAPPVLGPWPLCCFSRGLFSAPIQCKELAFMLGNQNEILTKIYGIWSMIALNLARIECIRIKNEKIRSCLVVWSVCVLCATSETPARDRIEQLIRPPQWPKWPPNRTIASESGPDWYGWMGCGYHHINW